MEAPTQDKTGSSSEQKQAREEAVNRIITITAGLPVGDARRFISGVLTMDEQDKTRLHELHDSLRSLTRQFESLGGDYRN